MNNCTNCGAPVEGAANYCVRCGSRLASDCPNCGAANQPDSRFCHYCGYVLLESAQPVQQPAAVLCPRCRSTNDPGTTFCYSCGLPLDEFGAVPRRAMAASGVPAGFWIRLLAWLIDTALLVGVHLILLTAMPGISIESYYSDDSFWTAADSVMAIVGAVYYTVGVSVFSTTVGKRVLGLYVLRRDGAKISVPRAFGRHLASGLSVLLLGIGYLMIGFSSDKRGLHDHICDTVVVKR